MSEIESQTKNKISGQDGSDNEDNNISPRSREQIQNISSGIYRLVDDITSPQPIRDAEQQFQSLSIGGRQNAQNLQSTEQCSIFEKEFGNPGTQNQIFNKDLAGSTPFPGFGQNQEYFQNNTQGVGDFQNIMPQQQQQQTKQRMTMSRYSSDDDSGHGGKFPQNFSRVAVDEGSNLEENYLVAQRSWIDSNSDYQESLDRFGYIFQSPEYQQNNQNQWQNQQKQQQYMYNQGGYQGQQQPMMYTGPHHTGNAFGPTVKPHIGTQNRASSFDKVAQQPDYHQQPFNLAGHNEDLETYSAASSGNHSAFSEGDIYNNQVYGTPQQYYPSQNQYYFQQSSNGVPSNQAAYGFTPNIQFSGSNQKQQSFSNYGPPIRFTPDGQISNLEQKQVSDDFTPGGSSNFPNEIQLTGLDVNLQNNQIGVSPQRIHELKNQSNIKNPHIGSNQMRQEFTNDNTHGHSLGHNQYKTPSPYRNNESGIQFNPHQIFSNQQKNLRPGNMNVGDPFYPQGYQFKDQRQRHGAVNPHTVNNHYHHSNPQQRTSLIDQYVGGNQNIINIGLNAPPMVRGIDFNHNEPQNIMMGHGGPMIAMQHAQNMHPHHHNPHYGPQQQPPPLLKNLSQLKTNSQERDPSYQPANFMPSQQLVQQVSKTVVNTPTHNSQQDNKSNMSVGSQNSNNSQQFQGLIMDTNEKLLFQIIKQFDECTNPVQKLDIIRGNVSKLALTQTGSRFLQKQLTKANSSIVSFFLDEIQDHLPELMVDNYGNYFCQRLLSSCSGDQRLAILRGIQAKFIEICCNKKGTHTIQTMFELVNLPDEEEFIRNALIGNIVRLSKDPQGTHVVQKVMTSFEESKRQFIYDEVFAHFIELAKNTNGLCVIKKYVSTLVKKEHQAQLMDKIQENAIDLVQDPYGNYAITEVINQWDIEMCYPIYNILRSRICQLSNQKFSSNVIERCLEKADENMRSQFIEELSLSDKLTGLIRNSYGNYVVQKSLKIAKGKDKDQLIQAIQVRIPEINDRKIRTKWEQIVQEAVGGMESSNFIDDNGKGSPDGNGSHRLVMVKQRSNSNENNN